MKFDVVEEMPDDDPVKILGTKMGNKFTEMVDKLRSNSNTHLAALGKLTWRLVGNRVVPFSMTEQIQVIGLGVMACGSNLLGVIMAPPNWLEQVENNPVHGMAGIVFVASQARDYWNGKIKGPPGEDVILRAMAYEAEYLLTHPNLVPTDYQKRILDKFPNGLASAPELVYQGKPYMDAA